MVDCHPRSPFRPPDWRWQLASILRQEGQQPSRRLNDPHVHAAMKFQEAYENCSSRSEKMMLAFRHPALHDAHSLKFKPSDDFQREEVEARILARQNNDEISAVTDFDPSAVEWYERLFFHVRDRLDKPSYVIHRVIGPGIHGSPSERDVGLWWKLIGYRCGPVVLESMVYLVREYRVESMDEYDHSIHTEDARKRRTLLAALTLQTRDPYQKMQLLELDARYQEVQREYQQGGSVTGELIRNIEACLLNSDLFAGTYIVDHPAPHLLAYDDQAAELRASEQILIAADKHNETIKATTKQKLPELVDAKTSH